MIIEIDLFGQIPSKKNRYLAVIKKKTGKAGLVKDRKMRAKYDYLVEQVPTEYFDLQLKHPTITFQRYATADGFCQDRDGIATTIFDEILVRLGIIIDDSDIHNNGLWIFKPTQLSDAPRLRITLESQEHVLN